MSMCINLLIEHQSQLSNPVLRYHFLRGRYSVSPEGKKKDAFREGEIVCVMTLTVVVCCGYTCL